MNKELIDYIKQQISVNVSKNKITDILLQQGWRQSEIDEAFLAARGKSNPAVDPVGGDFGARQFDEAANDGGSSGSNKKVILLAAAVLAVLVIAIGAIIFPSLVAKKESSNSNPVPAPEQPASTPEKEAEIGDAGQTSTGQTGDETVTDVDPTVLAAIKELEDSIQAPDGWIAREGLMRSRPLAAFFKPIAEKDSNGNDIFSENISVTREDIAAAGVADGNAYITKSKQDLQKKISDYKIMSERKVNLSDGTQATLIGSSFTQKEIALKSMQLFAFKDTHAYIITGVVLSSNWDNEKDMIGASVMSFKFPAGN